MAQARRPRWHHRPWVQQLLGRVLAGYIRLLEATGRWQLQYDPATAALLRAGRPFIFAFWHGRMLMILPAWRALLRELGVRTPPQPYVMSSPHGDGRLMAAATARFGLRTIYGSSRKGGVKVLLEARKILRGGDIIVITPDGPRGPRMRAQGGIVQLAQSAAVPIVPITFAAAAGQTVLGSWDRFVFVWPFARGILAFGAPLELAGDRPLAESQALVERHITELTQAADRACGLAPVAPTAAV
jgi:hypothetical protein